MIRSRLYKGRHSDTVFGITLDDKTKTAPGGCGKYTYTGAYDRSERDISDPFPSG